MFSKNTYMYPHAASPSSHPRTSSAAASLVGLNGSELLLHHHHDMLSGHHLSAAALYDQHVMGGLNGDPNSAMAAAPCAVAKASKKDRHSKIETAQGPRDRRVRLSIGVARKFFDLQESLGFDKPSKTLDWLLTKSETAINDLEQMREKTSTEAAKSGGGGGSASPSECEVDSAEAFPNGADLKDKLKESRMKARARARERTREKMCIKKLNETRNNNNGGGCDLRPVQLMNDNQLHDFRNINLGFRGEAMLHCHQTYEAAAAAHDQDLIQESIVMKRKVKHHHPSILGFQQNLIISSSNYGVPPLYNAAAADNNWDNICAIWDHHKFINSTSNN